MVDPQKSNPGLSPKPEPVADNPLKANTTPEQRWDEALQQPGLSIFERVRLTLGTKDPTATAAMISSIALSPPSMEDSAKILAAAVTQPTSKIARELIRCVLLRKSPDEGEELVVSLRHSLPVLAYTKNLPGQWLVGVVRDESEVPYTGQDAVDCCGLLKRPQITDRERFAVAQVMASRTSFFSSGPENWSARQQILRAALDSMQPQSLARLSPSTLPILVRQEGTTLETIVHQIRNDVSAGAPYSSDHVDDVKRLLQRPGFDGAVVRSLRDHIVNEVLARGNSVDAMDPKFLSYMAIIKHCNGLLNEVWTSTPEDLAAQGPKWTSATAAQKLRSRVASSERLAQDELDAIGELQLDVATLRECRAIARDGLIHSPNSLHGMYWCRLTGVLEAAIAQVALAKERVASGLVKERFSQRSVTFDIFSAPNDTTESITLSTFATKCDIPGLIKAWVRGAYSDGTQDDLLQQNESLIAEFMEGTTTGPAARSFEDRGGMSLIIDTVPGLGSVQIAPMIRAPENPPSEQYNAGVDAIRQHLISLGYEIERTEY